MATTKSTESAIAIASSTDKLELKYISAKEAVKRFDYLYKYNKDLYSRASTELTVEEYTAYQLTLSVPKLSPDGKSLGTCIRVTEPFQIFEFEGKEYLASGNSRMKTIQQMIERGSKEEFADIPYVVLPIWNNEELLRIQYATNDHTRKNDRLVKLQQIAAYIKRTIEHEMANDRRDRTDSKISADVKKEAERKFSLNATEIKNALLIVSQKVPAIVIEYLNQNLVKVDPAIELVNISNVLKVDPAVVVGELMAQQKPISIGNVKKWRENFVKTSTSKEAVVENHLVNNNETAQQGETPANPPANNNNRVKPPAPPTPTERRVESPGDAEVKLVKLGEFKLRTNEDAIASAYVVANLIENNLLNNKHENVTRQLFQLMEQLKDLEITEDRQKAIAAEFEKK